MKTKLFALAGLLAVLFLVSAPVEAQTNSFTQTTLSAAMTTGGAANSSNVACLTSATGVVQSSFGAAGSFLMAGAEQMQVTTVTSFSATCFNVSRVEGRTTAHASGDPVYIGAGNWFQRIDPVALSTCTLTSLFVHPWINSQTGAVSVCNQSKWQSIQAMTVKVSTQLDAVTGTTGTTLTSVAGMVVTVLPGTYKFSVLVPGVTTANAGSKLAFKYATAALTSIESTARAYTASAVAVTHNTTTTDQTLIMDNATGVVIYTEIVGTMVVSTGGTITLQAAQHTAHVDTESVYVGGSMTFTRI
jgi:hypothetical protein